MRAGRFGDLDARSADWARTLVARGVVADDLVAFSLPNGPEFIALTFGIYRAGATPAPISGKLPAFERDAILAVMQPRLFLTATDEANPNAPSIAATPVATSWKACTSGGSTGTPKVIVDGRPAEFAERTEFIGIPADAVVLVPGPLYHNASFSAAVFALWQGSAVVTMDRFNADGALALIARERVAWSIMVPTMLHRIRALPTATRDGHDLSSWRMVVHTAAPMADCSSGRGLTGAGPVTSGRSMARPRGSSVAGSAALSGSNGPARSVGRSAVPCCGSSTWPA